MGKLVGLTGVKGGEITDLGFFGSVTAGMRELRKHRAITTASDNGAIAIWRYDSGVYRCERYRHLITIDAAYCDTKAEIREWLKENLPAIE